MIIRETTKLEEAKRSLARGEQSGASSGRASGTAGVRGRGMRWRDTAVEKAGRGMRGVLYTML
jgi:hypothetical protein